MHQTKQSFCNYVHIHLRVIQTFNLILEIYKIVFLLVLLLLIVARSVGQSKVPFLRLKILGNYA
jgi:hypothetical protein